MQDEPVAIPGAIMAVVVAGFGLAVLLGVPLSVEQVGGITTFAGAVIALVTVLQRKRSVAAAKVVERVDGRTVIAGEANDALLPGEEIRELGDYEPQHAATPTDPE